MKFDEFSENLLDLLCQYSGEADPPHVIVMRGPTGKTDVISNVPASHMAVLLKGVAKGIDEGSMLFVDKHQPPPWTT